MLGVQHAVRTLGVQLASCTPSIKLSTKESSLFLDRIFSKDGYEAM